MNTFDSLSQKEQQEFLKFPVYISLLAANKDGETDEKEKQVAIAFDHMKTYSCNPTLADFYSKADKAFEKSIIELDNELPQGEQERETAIKAALTKLEKLLLKFDETYRATMHQSMRSFTEHVSAAHFDALENLIFPIPIKGLTY
ncbi:hypothetical protein [Pedobacter sp. UYP1]|uniref:hypothetical protein n=1 Tax=Pedobacter sp. UYP1 TaxID=1756396 RepID=UPI0033972894